MIFNIEKSLGDGCAAKILLIKRGFPRGIKNAEGMMATMSAEKID
jgi:hypothetical protein